MFSIVTIHCVSTNIFLEIITNERNEREIAKISEDETPAPKLICKIRESGLSYLLTATGMCPSIILARPFFTILLVLQKYPATDVMASLKIKIKYERSNRITVEFSEKTFIIYSVLCQSPMSLLG